VETQILSDKGEDTLPTILPLSLSTIDTVSSHSPCIEAVNELGCEGQVNRSIGKKKKKLAMED